MVERRVTVRTRESLRADLRGIGLRPGDVVLVHASLSSLGYVCGGATAVVQALLDVLGPAGTLVVPTQTATNRDPSTWTDPVLDKGSWATIREHLPAFDPAVTPSVNMGAVAEQVRTFPGAKRSGHPQTSFAAIGPRAEALMAGHQLESPLGDESPLARLEEVDARVLLLGVGMTRNTSFHLAECRLPRAPRRVNGCAVLEDSRRQWVQYSGVRMNDADFGQLGKAFETETNEVTVGEVGDAVCRLFSVRAAVTYALSWLPAHRGLT